MTPYFKRVWQDHFHRVSRHLWSKPHGSKNLLNRRHDTSARWWTGTVFTRLKSQTMNMNTLHPQDLTLFCPVWSWMSLLRPFSKLRINHFITICQLRTKLFIPNAHFPVPLSTSFYLTFTSTPVTSPVGLLVISATRTDGLLHLALFRQHVLTCSPIIHLSQFVMRTTFLLATRNGSYGLLRRPIRYNTLLIPNMRMIRKRIYAILEDTLGLHQPPSNHHELSPQPPEHYNASW
jgi:hypothetical protein